MKEGDKALIQKHSGKKKFGCIKQKDQGPPTWAQRFEVASGARISSMWDRLDYERSKRLNHNVHEHQQVDRLDIKNILTAIVNRRNLTFSLKQIFVSRVCCCCKKRFDRHQRYVRLYNSGEKRLKEKELDIQRIV